MSERKHTPGPWGVEQTYSNNWIGPMRRSGDGKVERVVCHTDREDLTDETRARNDADALLIAAAPELLRCLETLLPLVKHYRDEGPSEDEGWQSKELETALKESGEVIAKAKGGAA